MNPNMPAAAYPPPTMPPPRRGRLGYVAAYVAGLATGLAILAAVQLLPTLRPEAAPTPVPAAETLTMSGTQTMPLYGSDDQSPNWELVPGDRTACQGKVGYDDMAEGTSVTVYDSSGTVIGTGVLQQGRAEGQGRERQCVWRFTVTALPASDFYQVEISHRGKVTVQRSDLEAVDLTLG